MKLLRSLSLTVFLILVGFSLSNAQIDVTLPDTSYDAAGDTVQIPVKVGDLTGEGVLSYDFTVAYDSTVLDIIGVNTSGTISSNMSVVANTNDPDTLKVSAASGSELSGSGTLIYLKTVLEKEAKSDINFIEFVFNEGSPQPNTTDGTVLVNVESVGVTISDSLSGKVGGQIQIPLRVDTLDGLGVTSYEFDLNYDDSILDITGAETSGTISDGMTISTNSSTGTFSIAASSTDTLSGVGTLIYLNANLTAAGQSSLSLSNFMFNEGNPIANLSDGLIDIAANSAPVADALSDTTNEDTALDLTLSATDADGDSLSFTIITNPSNGSLSGISGIDPSTAEVTYTPSEDYNGQDSFDFTVSDGAVTDTASVAITVEAVNDAPAFTSTLNDTTIKEDSNLTFTYQATDTEGDAFSFELIQSPANATIDSATGELSFTPDFEQAGDYTLKVIATDGNLADTTSASLTVENVNRAPLQTSLLTPKDTTIELRGMPSNNIPVMWNASSDPDGDNLSYTIEVATESSFDANTQVGQYDAGSDTSYQGLTYGKLDQQLEDAGISIGSSEQLHIRVNSADGIDTTLGTASTFTIERGLVKGTFTIREARNIQDDTKLTIKGVLTTPDYGSSHARFFIQDTSAGINVTYPGVGGNSSGSSPFSSADSASITGVKVTNNGRVQLQASSHTMLGTADSLPAAKSITINQWNNLAANGLLGMRVSINDLTLFNTNQWPQNAISSGSGVTVTAGPSATSSDTVRIRIDRGQSHYDGSSLPPDQFKITGVADHVAGQAQLWPFYQGDIEKATSMADQPAERPSEFKLVGNYPNPFNPTTTIKYNIPKASEVQIEVYNMLGKKVATLVNEKMSAGSHTVTFEAGNLTSGIYLYRMRAGQFSTVKKMMLVK